MVRRYVLGHGEAVGSDVVLPAGMTVRFYCSPGKTLHMARGVRMAVRAAEGQDIQTVATGPTVRNMKFSRFDSNQSKQVRKLSRSHTDIFDLCGEVDWLPDGIHLCNSPDNANCMQGSHECEGVLDVYDGTSDIDIVACRTSDERAPVDYGGGATVDDIRTSQTFLDTNRLCDLLKTDRKAGQQFDGEFAREFDALPEEQQAFFMLADDEVKYWWYLRDLWQNTSQFDDAELLLHRLTQLRENFRSVYEDLLCDWMMGYLSLSIVPIYKAERAAGGNFYEGISSDIARVLMRSDDDPYLQFARQADVGYAEWLPFLRIYVENAGDFSAGTKLDDYLNKNWIPRADLSMMNWLGDDEFVIDSVTEPTILRLTMRKSILQNNPDDALESYNMTPVHARALVWSDEMLAAFLTSRGIQPPG
ncbi:MULTISPECIES: putative adhesin [Streptomyces]|uniref:putative adhesin n=1 Tax=Streptomyces TaxID=1883 RepID=UPI0031FEE728